MNLQRRLRILLDSRRKTFSPPKQPLSKAIVQGYDRTTGRYIVGQGGGAKVMPSLSTGSVAVGGGVNGGALGFDSNSQYEISASIGRDFKLQALNHKR